MKIDESNSNHLLADTGKVLQRISDKQIFGPEVHLGYTYYLNGKQLDEPLCELFEHYEEIDAPEESQFNNDLNKE